MFASKNNPYAVVRPEQIFERLGVQGGFSVANLVSLFALIPRLCIISAHQLQTQNYEVPLDGGVKVVMML
jgi:hypothetical protein